MKHFLYILILVCFVGCNGVEKPKKPKNLIAKEKMSEIMYELYILNAAKGVNRKLLELNGIMPLEYIYKRFDIDSLQFAESNKYYAFDTEVYSAIVEKVRIDLQKDKDLYEKLNEEDQRVRDSTRIADKKKKDSINVVKSDSVN